MRIRSPLLVMLLALLLPWSAVANALATECLRMKAQAANTPALMDAAATMDAHCPHRQAMNEIAHPSSADEPAPRLAHADCNCPQLCTAGSAPPMPAVIAALLPLRNESLPMAPAAMPRKALPSRLLRPPALL